MKFVGQPGNLNVLQSSFTFGLYFLPFSCENQLCKEYLLNCFIFQRFKRLISGENIFLTELHLAVEKIFTFTCLKHI